MKQIATPPLSSSPKILPRSFFEAPPTIVAPQLLNKLFVRNDGRVGRIVEVEAYTQDDPAAHTFRGLTKRNRTMFGPAGHMYVYFTYGMHWCCNAVCEGEGIGAGVLLRALEPLEGLALMRDARGQSKSDRELCNGPGKLAQAFSVKGEGDGIDLCDPVSAIVIASDGIAPPDDPVVSRRIGLSVSIELPLRWYVPGSRYISKR